MTFSAAARVRLVAVVAVVATLGAIAPAPATAKLRAVDPVDVTAFQLSPELATWMVGPVGWMATQEEIEAYVALSSDEAAAELIEAFWRRRDPDPATPSNHVRRLFDERVAEADKLYREAGKPGHRTDRGTIFVLYGPPVEIEFRIVPRGPIEETVEEWRYPKAAEKGLDGERPDRVYRFAKEGDLTVFYRKPIPRSLLRPR